MEGSIFIGLEEWRVCRGSLGVGVRGGRSGSTVFPLPRSGSARAQWHLPPRAPIIHGGFIHSGPRCHGANIWSQ